MKAMGNTFFWSDLHLGHDLVAKARGFASVEEHDRHIIDRWDATVTPNDTIWLLGDNATRKHRSALSIIGERPGTKRLIWGNHDPGHPSHSRAHTHLREHLEVFQTAGTVGSVKVGGHTALLSHFPYTGEESDGPDRCAGFRQRDVGWWLIHGHVHTAWLKRDRQINVGVDQWMDGPASLKDLAALVASGPGEV